MLEEVESKFLSKVGDKSLTAKEAGLSRTVRSSFQDICIKYDDVRCDICLLFLLQIVRCSLIPANRASAPLTQSLQQC